MDTDCIPRKRRYVFASKTKSVEWFMTAFMIGQGVTLAVPGDTFAMSAYRDFLRIGLDQTDVATFYLVIGFVRCVTLYRNGHLEIGPEIRFFCSLIGAATWLLAGILFLMPALRGAPLPMNAAQHFVMFAAEMYAIGVAAFDRARRS